MEPIAQSLDLLAQWPLLALAVVVSVLTGAAKAAGNLDKTNAGIWLLPLLPLVLGAIGCVLIRPELGIANGAIVGAAVGAVSAHVYAAFRRNLPGKP